jgi:hypothetical protein
MEGSGVLPHPLSNPEHPYLDEAASRAAEGFVDPHGERRVARVSAITS